MIKIADDWLAPEELIVARLKDQVKALRAVYSTQEIDSLEGQADPRAPATPSAHVFYAGDRPMGGTGQGDIQVIDQLWGVGLVVVNARGAPDARKDAGALIPLLLRSVVGWDCGVIGLKPFRRAPIATTPRYYNGGKAIFPLFFATRVIA